MFAYAQARQAGVDFQLAKGRIYRLIANLEPLATLGYVDDLAEQVVLERMLEQVKPPLPEVAAPLHPVLRAPFRYPGLPQNNGLSRAHEPGVYYGGSSAELALADAAYARLLFLRSIKAETLPAVPIRSEHSLVVASYRAEYGVCLTDTDIPGWYPSMAEMTTADVQPLMTGLRRQGAEVVEYQTRMPLGSAGTGAVRLCKAVALLSPTALVNAVPQIIDHWLCEARPEEVIFSQVGHANLQVFREDDFL